MQNVFRTTLSVFLLLTLFWGLVDSCFNVFYETDSIEWSDLSDSDEEDATLKEQFKKRMVYQEVYHQGHFILVHSIVCFWFTPSCLLEGHTGQVTPPPWA